MSNYGSPSPHFQEQDGFIWISKEGVQTILAGDLSAKQTSLIYGTQTAPSASLPEEKADTPAWKNKPSWYIIANNDQAVPPDLQRDLSKRMQATTVALESSHFAMISHAKEVSEVIREAAANS